MLKHVQTKGWGRTSASKKNYDLPRKTPPYTAQQHGTCEALNLQDSHYHTGDTCRVRCPSLATPIPESEQTVRVGGRV